MLNPDISQKLRSIVGEANFKEEQEALVAYSYDATPMYQHLPDGVIFPSSTEQVSEILKVLNEHQIPIVGRGAGSNLCAGTVPVEGGIVMVMTRMNKLIEIDTENLTATFQPGLNTKQFHQAVERLGLFYPPDPSSMVISTLGGNIMECAGGLRGLKYGTTKDYVIGLEAVLPSGEVIRTGGKLYKDVAGYDLTKLLVGSEGTLAIIINWFIFVPLAYLFIFVLEWGSIGAWLALYTYLTVIGLSFMYRFYKTDWSNIRMKNPSVSA